MTAEETKRLKLYEKVLQEIATKIENQQEYDDHLRTQVGISHDRQDLRAATYGKIVRIMNVHFKRDPSDRGFAVLDPALLNVDEGG